MQKIRILPKFSTLHQVSDICMDTSLSHNSCNFVSGTTETTNETDPILYILEELKNNASANFIGCHNNCNTKDSRIKGYFCSDSLQLK